MSFPNLDEEATLHVWNSTTEQVAPQNGPLRQLRLAALRINKRQRRVYRIEVEYNGTFYDFEWLRKLDSVDYTPIPSSELWDMSQDHWRVYEQASPSPLFDWARYFLAGHAVETALKAFLHPRIDVVYDEMEFFGHDLSKLLEIAKQNGLSVDAKVTGDIDDLNYVHNNLLARYPNFHGKTTGQWKDKSGKKRHVVALSELHESMAKILEEVRKGLGGALYVPDST